MGICIPSQHIRQELKADKDNYGFVVGTSTDCLRYAITFTSDKETFGYHTAKDWFEALKAWKRELEPVRVIIQK